MARTANETTPAAPQAAPSSSESLPAKRAGAQPGEPMNPKEVRAALDQYFEKMGNTPASWQDMISARIIKSVPQGKDGKPLDFRDCVMFLTRQPQ